MNHTAPPATTLGDSGSSESGAVRRTASAPAGTPVSSDWLLAGQRELQIVHQGVTYRLQATRQGKLILTK
jgi:hemin uptake protein HemP